MTLREFAIWVQSGQAWNDSADWYEQHQRQVKYQGTRLFEYDRDDVIGCVLHVVWVCEDLFWTNSEFCAVAENEKFYSTDAGWTCKRINDKSFGHQYFKKMQRVKELLDIGEAVLAGDAFERVCYDVINNDMAKVDRAKAVAIMETAKDYYERNYWAVVGGVIREIKEATA